MLLKDLVFIRAVSAGPQMRTDCEMSPAGTSELAELSPDAVLGRNSGTKSPVGTTGSYLEAIQRVLPFKKDSGIENSRSDNFFSRPYGTFQWHANPGLRPAAKFSRPYGLSFMMAGPSSHRHSSPEVRLSAWSRMLPQVCKALRLFLLLWLCSRKDLFEWLALLVIQFRNRQRLSRQHLIAHGGVVDEYRFDHCRLLQVGRR